jgi:tetratricopeptide (TPR) repeat protein
VAEKYQAISDEEQKKANVFFEKARTVGATGNYEFAIEMYIQGLNIDPENVAAHQELREISLKRKVSGGKPMGMFSKPSINNKDDKLNMLNAEKILAYDPGNTDYMEAIFQNAHKAGFFDTVMWMGPILQKANAESKKPELNKFIVVKDVYKSLARDVATPPRVKPVLWKRATDACHYAAKMRPDEMDLQTELKNLGAEQTTSEGGYDTGGSFRDSIKNRDEQEKLQAQDKGVQELGVMGKLITAAEAEYKADPNEPGKLMKLVDSLEKTEHPDYEGRALELLQEWHEKTKQFRFRKRMGEIQMRQLRRMEQSAKEYAAANPTDEQAQADLKQVRQEKNEFELKEYQLWAENYPTDMTFKFQAAQRMFALGMYEESIPFFQQAEADAKFRNQARILLGRAFYELKFYDEAIDTLDGLVKEYQNRGDENSKQMHYWAARAHEDRGDAEVAIKLYSAIVRMEFNFKDVQQRIKKLRAGLGGNAAQA